MRILPLSNMPIWVTSHECIINDKDWSHDYPSKDTRMPIFLKDDEIHRVLGM